MLSLPEIDVGEVVELLRKMVQVNSVNPVFGGPGEGELASFISGELSSLGLNVHLQEVAQGRSNVVAVLRGEGGGSSLLLNGHMDTVGASEELLKARVEKGVIHGRGACDMKGGLAAMILALRGLVESRIRLRGDLLFAAVVDEEDVSLGMEKLVKEYRVDGGIVGEPTGLDVIVAHKGFVWLSLESRGRSAHGSKAELGVDAVTNAARIILGLRHLGKVYVRKRHKLVGEPNIHVSKIRGGEGWSIVPTLCEVMVERRTLPRERPDDIVSEIESLVKSISAEEPTLDVSVKKIFSRDGMEISEHEPIVKAVVNACSSVRHKAPSITGVSFWTDAGILVNEAHVPTCVIGPGRIVHAHAHDEQIRLSEVILAAHVYALTAQLYCGVK